MSLVKSRRLIEALYGVELYEAAWGRDSFAGQPVRSGTIHGRQHIDLGHKFDVDLLVREEYEACFDFLEDRHKAYIADHKHTCRVIVTGQPGIGKSLFLVYALIRRLMNCEPTALQLGSKGFLLFDQHGVRRFPGDERRSGRLLGPTVWALFDGDSHYAPVPGDAFSVSSAFVIMASSPQSSRWKGWKKQEDAILCLMDLWSEGELRQLFQHLFPTMVERAVQLSQRHGPSPRLIRVILAAASDGMSGPANDADKAVAKGVRKFLSKPGTALLALDELDFDDDFASAVFFCRPKVSADGEGDRDLARFLIPTAFLLDRLVEGMMAKIPAARQELLDAMKGVDAMREATEQVVDALGNPRRDVESGQAAPSSCIR